MVRCCAVALSLFLSAASTFAQTATVTGRVTAAATGLPISGVQIRLRDSGGAFLFAASSASTGTYTVTGVTPGTYYLSTHNGLGYADETRDGSPCVGVCDLVAPLILAAGQAAQQDFALDRGAVISGRVLSAATGQPVQSRVTLYSANHLFIGLAIPQADGTYVLNRQEYLGAGSGIAASTYYVVASGAAYNGVTCGSDASCLSKATPIRVAAAQAISGIDLFLPAAGGGSISGHITDKATGAPVTSGTVWVRGVGAGTWTATPDANGRFTIGSLSPGRYKASVAVADKVGQVFNGLDAPRCTPSVASNDCGAEFAVGTEIPVGPGEAVTGVDFSLRNGGAISGHITRSGQPQGGGAQVFGSAGIALGSASADATGLYTVRGLAGGTYFVLAASSGAARMLYASRSCPASFSGSVVCTVTAGTPVTVADGATTAGIDFDLAPVATTLAGKVTGAANGAPIAAGMALFLGDRSMGTTTAASDGTYAFTNLEPGAYRVRASAAGFVAEWFDNACAVCGDRGTAVQMASGASVGNVDFQLDSAAKITGRVTFGAATRTAGSTVVEALRADGSQVASAFASGGVYTIDGLPAGSYIVRARTILAPAGGGIPQGHEYAPTLYDNVPCDGPTCPLTGATPVTVSAGSTVSGIDLTLQPGGFIEGNILADGAPIDPAFSVASFPTRHSPACISSPDSAPESTS